MNTKNLLKQPIKSQTTRYFTILTFAFFVACGSGSEKDIHTKKNKDEGKTCANIKKAECDSNDGKFDVREVDSCEITYGSDCEVFTEGEGECMTTVLCERSVSSCNNESVMCPNGYDQVDCTIGEGTCIASEKGVCLALGGCDCRVGCGEQQVEVPNCSGENCNTIAECGGEIKCLDCAGSCDGAKVRVAACSPGETCTEIACGEDPAQSYFCEGD